MDQRINTPSMSIDQGGLKQAMKTDCWTLLAAWSCQDLSRQMVATLIGSVWIRCDWEELHLGLCQCPDSE